MIKEDDVIDPLAFIEDAQVRKVINQGKLNISLYSGANNKLSREIKANYDQSPSEKVLQGPTNSLIILGKDRNAGISSGYGGSGHSGCAAIDIIAGFMGPRPVGNTEYGSITTHSKDFKNDSSRIYLSQMTNIDEYFDLPQLSLIAGVTNIPLENSRGTAGIGIKSDNIRIIGRENVKIVTLHGSFNSLSRRCTDNGIDIVAGINVAATGVDPFLSLQPMVKGNNLLAALQAILEKIENTQATVSTFMQTQREINKSLLNHFHQSSIPGSLTSNAMCPEVIAHDIKFLVDTIPDIINNIKGIVGFDASYFNASSPKYILSRFNKVN